jgi:GT2 family glycosyltransferase
MKKLVSIVIVTYNSSKYIFDCIKYIKKQDFSYEIIIIDNDSRDKKKIELIKGVKKIMNKNNLGFSKANNKGIRISKGKYILLLNADVMMEKNFLKNMVECFKQDKKIGFVQAKLIKPWDHGILDSTGILFTKNRVFFDRGRGERDEGQYDEITDIFSGCGAALMFRKEALDDVRYGNEFLDEDFFAYLEDVDLCWRMGKNRWKGKLCAESVGYHYRGHDLQRFGTTGFFRFLKIRLKSNKKNDHYKMIRRNVFRNNYLIKVKNESFRCFFRDFFHIIFSEIYRNGYRLLFEPYVFKEIPTMIRLTGKMIKKRKSNNKMLKNEPIQ